MMEEVFILSACRTPIGKFQGSFEGFPASNLGAIAIKEALSRAHLPATEVDEVIMGQVLTAGQGQNPARQASLAANIPTTVPAYTVNMMCGSGLKSVFLGYQAIRSGDANVVITGGQENMSLAEHTAYLRKGAKLGGLNFKDSLLKDGLTDSTLNIHMGNTAEHIAKAYNVCRERQDTFAAESQAKAEKALLQQLFKDETVPVSIPPKNKIITEDEYPKPGTTVEKLRSLQPAFVKDGTGTITAGNSSGINDGAAAVILCSGKVVAQKDLKPLAKIVAFAQVGVDPIEMGIAPGKAVEKLLKKMGWKESDVDLYEMNEAFAAQAVAAISCVSSDHDKFNINGGAIALGHPLGASGTRILVTLIYNLKRLGKKRGVAALCIGGGMGIAIAIEMC